MWKYFLMKKHWTNSLLFNHKYQSLWRLAAYCLDGAVFAGPDQLCELCTLCWRKLLCVVCCFLKPAYNKNKTSRSWNVSYVSFKHTDYSLRSQVSFIESFTGSHFSVLPFSNVLVLLLELGMGELNHILRFLIRKCIFLNSFLFYTMWL